MTVRVTVRAGRTTDERSPGGNPSRTPAARRPPATSPEAAPGTPTARPREATAGTWTPTPDEPGRSWASDAPGSWARDERHDPGGHGGPTLVLVAHGTRDPAGEAVLAALAARVRARRPGSRVELAFLEISSPPLPDVLAGVSGPVVVVPLLLAGGYHVHIDLPNVIAKTRPGTMVARQLGPHPLITSVLGRRLAAAGLRTADAVILGAAGSSDPCALEDVRAAARLLSVRLARPVTAAFMSAGGPTVPEALDLLRRGPVPRIAVASYLLAPGYFQRRLESCGADLVTAPLGVDSDLAALVWARHDEALAATGRPDPALLPRPARNRSGSRAG